MEPLVASRRELVTEALSEMRRLSELVAQGRTTLATFVASPIQPRSEISRLVGLLYEIHVSESAVSRFLVKARDTTSDEVTEETACSKRPTIGPPPPKKPR